MEAIDISKIYAYKEINGMFRIRLRELKREKTHIVLIKIPIDYTDTGLINIEIVENILNPIYTDFDTIDQMYNSLKNTDKSYFDFLPKYLYLYHESNTNILRDIRLSNNESYNIIDDSTIYRIHITIDNINEICEILSNMYDTYQHTVNYLIPRSEIKSVYITPGENKITIDDGIKPAHISFTMTKLIFDRDSIESLDKDALYMLTNVYGKYLYLKKLDYLPIDMLNRDKILSFFELESMYNLLNTVKID
jgi:hypothetical protein|nr:MAG TPA: hypothetical protein [Caudoviricetes sp.]